MIITSGCTRNARGFLKDKTFPKYNRIAFDFLKMYKDRKDAGQKLSLLLQRYRGENVIVYGLTRGGVPVAYEVAKYLNAPLEAFIVKKLGAPYQEELALGAITEGKEPGVYYNKEILSHMHLHESDLKSSIQMKMADIEELQKKIRPDTKLHLFPKAIAIIVDDGIATGSTMKAALKFFKKLGQFRITVAVPVGQRSVLEELGELADEVVCAEPVLYLEAVGEFYKDFTQVESKTVLALLEQYRKTLAKKN